MSDPPRTVATTAEEITGENEMSSTFAAQPHQSRTSHQAVSARRQRLSALEVVTLIVVTALLIIGTVAVRPRASVAGSSQTLQVQAGETLWSIAKTHPVRGLSTAQTVETIAHDNGLDGATLATGQTLIVPAGDERDPQMASR